LESIPQGCSSRMSLSEMNEFPERIRFGEFFLCLVLMSWCAAAGAANAGVVHFVQVQPPGVAAPAIDETFSDAQITLAPTQNGVDISSASATPWSLKLASTQAQPFAPACYERARRSSSASPNRPGLEFNYGGTACNPIGGRYKV